MDAENIKKVTVKDANKARHMPSDATWRVQCHGSALQIQKNKERRNEGEGKVQKQWRGNIKKKKKTSKDK